ncbi:MAG: YciI family protein [Phycisphaerales bacterium]|nr:YciI family protein [Phycisphaerales bacterium]
MKIIIPHILCLLLAFNTFASDELNKETYTFVYILTGPVTELDQKTQSEAFAGHFSNMNRMAENGDLLVAGPYGSPKTDENLRGLWIFSTDQTTKALELAETDPTGQLGVFKFEAVQLTTDDQLLELPRLEKEDEERRLADPEISDEWAGRAYFIASAETNKDNSVNRVSGVLLLGTLVAQDNTRIDVDHTLVLLKAETIEEANSILTKAGCDPEQWELDLWYSSKVHTQLPALRNQMKD